MTKSKTFNFAGIIEAAKFLKELDASGIYVHRWLGSEVRITIMDEDEDQVAAVEQDINTLANEHNARSATEWEDKYR